MSENDNLDEDSEDAESEDSAFEKDVIRSEDDEELNDSEEMRQKNKGIKRQRIETNQNQNKSGGVDSSFIQRLASEHECCICC